MMLKPSKAKNFDKIKNKIFQKEYDLIILGSGPAATVIINEIIKKKGKKILIIEKGNFFKNKYEKVYSKYLPIKLNSRVFSAGGSSNKWSNISTYFENYEMQSRWENKNKNLWPLNHKELIKLYKKLKPKFGFKYNKILKKDFKIPFRTRHFIASKNPINFKKFYSNNKIDFICNCEAETIDELGFKSIVTIKFSNKYYKLFSKKIIVCCGGLESVKLILKSIKKNKLKKIKNKKIIGSYFMEHPKFNLGILKFPKKNILEKICLKSKGNLINYYGLSLKENIQKKKNLLNTYFRVEKIFNQNNDNKYLDKIKSYIKLKLSKTFKINFKTNYMFRIFCEMKPEFSNRISLSNKEILKVNYRFGRIDIKTINTLIENLIKYFSYNPKEEKKIKISRKKLISIIEDASHHMGGLIYSRDKSKSIVDKNLRLIDTKNTYICSSAIFPSSGSHNPTLTICALALRLAKHLPN